MAYTNRENILVSDTSIVIQSVIITSGEKKTLLYSMNIPELEYSQNVELFAKALEEVFGWEITMHDAGVYSHEYDLDSPDCPDYGIMNDVALGICSYESYEFAGEHSLWIEDQKCTLRICLEGDAVTPDAYDRLIIQVVRRAVFS